eukprot:7289890-Pyramimonas_sp.AAC.1
MAIKCGKITVSGDETAPGENDDALLLSILLEELLSLGAARQGASHQQGANGGNEDNAGTHG